MPNTHFWCNAALVGVIIGAAVLSALIGTAAHALPLAGLVA
jgi:hypothetical protein